jgi:GT2 family glycosyltransferase
MSKLNVVIPVRNRLHCTQSFMNQIQSQISQSSMNVFLIFVDADSTDGTQEYLHNLSLVHENITILKGKSNWYWAKSAYKGIKYAQSISQKTDYVLLLNDDIFINSNYLKTLCEHILLNDGSVISSRSRFSKFPFEIHENYPYAIKNQFGVYCNRDNSHLPKEEIDIRILATGKGTAYPLSFFEKFSIRYKVLPHHMADLDLSFNGYSDPKFRVLTPANLCIFTDTEFGTNLANFNIFERLFSKKSPRRLISIYFFYSRLNGHKKLFQFLFKSLKSLIQYSVKLYQ